MKDTNKNMSDNIQVTIEYQRGYRDGYTAGLEIANKILEGLYNNGLQLAPIIIPKGSIQQ